MNTSSAHCYVFGPEMVPALGSQPVTQCHRQSPPHLGTLGSAVDKWAGPSAFRNLSLLIYKTLLSHYSCWKDKNTMRDSIKAASFTCLPGLPPSSPSPANPSYPLRSGLSAQGSLSPLFLADSSSGLTTATIPFRSFRCSAHVRVPITSPSSPAYLRPPGEPSWKWQTAFVLLPTVSSACSEMELCAE